MPFGRLEARTSVSALRVRCLCVAQCDAVARPSRLTPPSHPVPFHTPEGRALLREERRATTGMVCVDGLRGHKFAHCAPGLAILRHIVTGRPNPRTAVRAHIHVGAYTCVPPRHRTSGRFGTSSNQTPPPCVYFHPPPQEVSTLRVRDFDLTGVTPTSSAASEAATARCLSTFWKHW